LDFTHLREKLLTCTSKTGVTGALQKTPGLLQLFAHRSDKTAPPQATDNKLKMH
jgi:hypothetical protein